MESALRRSRLTRAPDGAALVAALRDLAPALVEYLPAQRWFGSKGRAVRRVGVADGAPLEPAGVPCALTLLDIGYADGASETYLLPLAARPVAAADATIPQGVRRLALLDTPTGDWALYDGLEDPIVCEALLRRVEEADRVRGGVGTFAFDRTPVLSQAMDATHPVPVRDIRRIAGEQSNTSVLYDERLVLKAFRRLAAGENPDLEISRFLTLKTRFRRVPLLAGFARYLGPDAERTVAVVHTFVRNEGDAWTWTLARLREFYAAARARAVPRTPADALAAARTLAGPYLGSARRLGEVTGELHAALASDPGDAAFAPERVAREDFDAWSASIEAQIGEGLVALREAGRELDVERLGRTLGTIRAKINHAVSRLSGVPLWKTRVHGDYHLGQVLRVQAEDDFVILDFEGEPARPLPARRAKHLPLRDVAGLLRSFTYAGYAGLFEAAGDDRDALRDLQGWRAAWETAAGEAFLDGYLAVTAGRGVPFVPASAGEAAILISLLCLERAAYELVYEVNNRPTWLPIPLAAIERELVA